MSQGVLYTGGGESAGATFSPCRRYRYTLWRRWAKGLRCVFVGLNPSTATETVDDQTIRKCVGFAKRWGFAEYWMLNCFAWRSTDPRALLPLEEDPVGPENDKWIADVAFDASRIVLAWGRHEFLKDLLPSRARYVELLIKQHARCEIGTLGRNGDGSPKHPLYLPNATEFCAECRL